MSGVSFRPRFRALILIWQGFSVRRRTALHRFAMSALPGPDYPYPVYYVPQPRSTPIGVIILGVLTILMGIGAFIIGVPVLLLSGFLGLTVGGFSAGLLAIIGFVLFIFGIVAIAAGVGLIRLRGWAWWLAFIAAILQFIGLVYMYSLVLAVLWLLILVYLLVVKKHFRPQAVAAVPA